MENFRRFDATDPYGRLWEVEFRWQQNAITIRHSDAVDAKFQLRQGDDITEKVIAVELPHLVTLSRKTGHGITDGWVSRLAALHLKEMIETDRDMEKTLVTATLPDLERHSARLDSAIATQR
ncbi:MAG TPA: hypothetical protein VER03_23350 [Bryobacteraceae bacterium]|nr:hypothetical protein [Bryobacteraceae bacterium]